MPSSTAAPPPSARWPVLAVLAVLAGFYTRLLALRKRHPALAHSGGTMQFEDGPSDAVVGFTRRGGGRRLKVTVNLSGQSQPVAGGSTLAPWAWRISA